MEVLIHSIAFISSILIFTNKKQKVHIINKQGYLINKAEKLNQNHKLIKLK